MRGRNNYRYAGLDSLLAAVRPALAEEGIAISQPIELRAGGPVLVSQLRHTSGEVWCSEWLLSWTGGPQDKGSELTFARRYTLEALVGVSPVEEEDDDGAAAQKASTKPQVTPPSSSPSPSGTSSAPVVGTGAAASEEGSGRWTPEQQRGFFADLDRAWKGGPDYYDHLAGWCEANKRPRPSEMTPAQRQRLITWLSDVEHRTQVMEWEPPQDAQAGAA